MYEEQVEENGGRQRAVKRQEREGEREREREGEREGGRERGREILPVMWRYPVW